MKSYRTLWVYGSSNSLPNVAVPMHESFWGLTAQELKVKEIVNYSSLRNSFDGVLHTLVSMQSEYNWADDFFLIGVPPLERWTVFDNHADTTTLASKIDTKNWKQEKFENDCFHGLINISFHNDKSTVLYEDRAWTETLALNKIFLLTSWLDSIKANYLIVNLSKNFDKNNIWRPTQFLLPYCLNHERSILFDKTYVSINENVNKPVDYNEYGWDGHHGPAGNKNFYENSILPKLKKCNLL